MIIRPKGLLLSRKGKNTVNKESDSINQTLFVQHGLLLSVPLLKLEYFFKRFSKVTGNLKGQEG